MKKKQPNFKTLRQLSRHWRKTKPKTFAKLDKRWDIKMIGPVSEFIIETISKQLNPKVRDGVKQGEYLYHGPAIEKELWKLLRKVRRMTQLEKKND